MLDDRLPSRSRLLLRRTMGRAAGPLDLSPVAHTFAIDDYACALAQSAGSSFPRRWIANAFGAYARVVTLAEADPDGLAAKERHQAALRRWLLRWLSSSASARIAPDSSRSPASSSV